MDLVPLDKEIQKKVYDDLFSPSLQQAWKALWNIASLVTTITLPIMYLNHYANEIFRNNIEKLNNKLKGVLDENIIETQPEIWVPILEKLTYTKNEKISDLFLELLKKASNKNEISLVHPKYIKIIENLSEDEALILEYLNKNQITRIFSLSINYEEKGLKWYRIALSKYTWLENHINLNFSQNLSLYINNLESLWILNYWWSIYQPDTEEFKPYEVLQKSKQIVNIKKEIEENWYIYKEKKWFFELTNLWEDFLEALYLNNDSI